MHEFAIAQDIVSSLEKSLGDEFGKITKINIEIGSFSGIVSDSLNLGLETIFKVSNINNDVKVLITERECMAKCECGNMYKIKNIFDICPKCNSPVREIPEGMDIYIDSVEISEDN